jgi:hypothetical protein
VQRVQGFRLNTQALTISWFGRLVGNLTSSRRLSAFKAGKITIQSPQISEEFDSALFTITSLLYLTAFLVATRAKEK